MRSLLKILLYQLVKYHFFYTDPVTLAFLENLKFIKPLLTENNLNQLHVYTHIFGTCHLPTPISVKMQNQVWMFQ